MPYPAKRAAERLGNSHGVKERNTGVRQGASAGRPVIPEPCSTWHPVAQGMYRAAKMSGQAQWYETTDWAMAWVACETLDRLYTDRWTAGLLAEFNAMAGELLWTEGSRRKARIELIKAGGDVDKDESEVNLKQIRAAMKVKPESQQ
jgi:hypothetical protein